MGCISGILKEWYGLLDSRSDVLRDFRGARGVLTFGINGLMNKATWDYTGVHR